MDDPTHVQKLSPLDLSMPRTYIRVLLVFEPTDPVLLQCGFDRVLHQIPWLSGQVFPASSPSNKSSSLEIRWNTKDAPTLVNTGKIDMSYKLASSRGMPAETIPSDIWPAPGLINGIHRETGIPVFAASIFRFVDQGMGLCVCLHHSAVDATGFSEIMRLWSQHMAHPGFSLSDQSMSRSEQLSEALALNLQKASSMSSADIFALHPEYSNIPPSLPDSFPVCRSKLFGISIHWIEILKDLMRKHVSTTPTTNTILCALIWTTITRIRAQRNPSLEAEKSGLATAVNVLQRIGDRFSTMESPFLGNAVMYSLSSFQAGALAASSEAPVRSLAQICDQISQSQSHSKINSRHIAEVYRLVDLMEDCTKSLFVGWDLFRSRDLTITSWADLDLYGLDFGAGIGKPKFVRLPSMEADGVAIILPRQRTGPREVLEVMVMLRSDDMVDLEMDTMWQTLQSGR